MIFVKSTILTGNLLKLINFQFANFYPGGAISQPNKVLVLQRAGAPKKVLNSGLGPKWDQSSNLVPKKSRFCLQVPNFFTLPSDAAEKRRHTAVGHCCALFRHICTMHNAYIEQLDSSVYKIEPYIILSYIL